MGQLWIVATPVGNLGDITYRAVEILRQVQGIAAEDTRHSRVLLAHYGIETPLFAVHAHNEQEAALRVIGALQAGESWALISDAGTPLISDPGARLVRACIEQGITVTPIPGPCAAIAALSVSGLCAESFVFEGFLPAKGAMRRRALEKVQKLPHTIILYESVHRILDLLAQLAELLTPSRQIVVARELTKRFESVLRGTAVEVLAQYVASPDTVRGEFVVLIEGAPETALLEGGSLEQALVDKLLPELLQHLPLKAAVSLLTKATGLKKNSLYEQAVKLQQQVSA
ncbi:MAG: 16S rRNA (cytidine(1402)-2'-O)-methyltransferase [Gammaproteobacteria bacterium RIFCSPHIGHO2_12_FULL_45_9]|nr:MAG: 16S rRNA (cytidine(1402)-2'-O)-methyltransferase [Gammaproteobacteria bacterium RIFCSPHIGHO2_12_FULL_45_9]